MEDEDSMDGLEAAEAENTVENGTIYSNDATKNEVLSLLLLGVGVVEYKCLCYMEHITVQTFLKVLDKHLVKSVGLRSEDHSTYSVGCACLAAPLRALTSLHTRMIRYHL